MAREEAREIGISSEQGVARYAAVCLVLGLGFTADPAFDQNQIASVTAPRLSESERLREARELILCQESRKPHVVKEIVRCMNGLGYGNPQETLARLYSYRHDQNAGHSNHTILEHFLGQDMRLSRLCDERIDLAVSLTGAFGFYWPRNPLYTPYLNEICDPTSAISTLRRYLLDIGVEDACPPSIWKVTAR